VLDSAANPDEVQDRSAAYERLSTTAPPRRSKKKEAGLVAVLTTSAVLALVILATIASSGVSTTGSNEASTTSSTSTGSDILLASVRWMPDRLGGENITFRVTMINTGNATETTTVHLSVYSNDTEYANLSASVSLDAGVVIIYPFTVSLPELMGTNETRSATAHVWIE
jgi:hypothetical protein